MSYAYSCFIAFSLLFWACNIFAQNMTIAYFAKSSAIKDFEPAIIREKLREIYGDSIQGTSVAYFKEGMGVVYYFVRKETMIKQQEVIRGGYYIFDFNNNTAQKAGLAGLTEAKLKTYIVLSKKANKNKVNKTKNIEYLCKDLGDSVFIKTTTIFPDGFSPEGPTNLKGGIYELKRPHARIQLLRCESVIIDPKVFEDPKAVLAEFESGERK